MASTPLIRLAGARFAAFNEPLSLVVSNNERLAVLGPKKSQLLAILAGKVVAEPPQSLSYPSFGKSVWPSQAIEMVQFGNSKTMKAPYLSARYESFRDEFDYSLRDVLQKAAKDNRELDSVAEILHLQPLLERWFASLSNGQTRRAQLALALLKKPTVLIVDEPYLGLDPENRKMMTEILGTLPIPLIVGLKSSRELPSWATHIAIASDEGVISGRKGDLSKIIDEHEIEQEEKLQKRTATFNDVPKDEKLIDLQGVSVKYKDQYIFKDLWLEVRRGERVHIKGPNGSGKSTLVAMLTADHPQSWNEKVVLFGEPREVGKHTFLDINNKIGQSSPEIHSIFPRNLTALEATCSGYANNFVRPKRTSPERLDYARKLCLKFGVDPNATFGSLSLADQKLVLFARALVKRPPILILDEAFSTLSNSQIETAFRELHSYDGSILIIGHMESEIPPVHKTLDLGGYST